MYRYSCLSMATWLNCFEKIKAIMSHRAISNPVGLIAELCIPVEKCIEESKVRNKNADIGLAGSMA